MLFMPTTLAGMKNRVKSLLHEYPSPIPPYQNEPEKSPYGGALHQPYYAKVCRILVHAASIGRYAAKLSG